jgi:ribosomal protein S18 acetylase RimI-like enzyme
MAAATEPRMQEVVDLRSIRVADLNPLLEEEMEEWMRRLGWDFRPSADLVRRFVGVGTLSGYALVSASQVVGYTYFIHEDSKGLIGDLYLSGQHQSEENEVRLLGAALEELFTTWGVERVESQLMMLRSPRRLPLPFAERLEIHPREFMALPMSRAAALKPGPAAREALIETWSPRRHDEAAQVIAQAYTGHIDANVNDQYRSAEGARRFLRNIVQYPGCGAFYQPASLVALDAWTGRACGVALASILSPRVGHVTQLSVVPRLKGRGLGYELLRRSLLALGEAGCHRASLTVTSANVDAARLYRNAGFQTAHRFAALVWDLFRGQATQSLNSSRQK